MRPSGYEIARDVLGAQPASVTPKPSEGENVRFVQLHFQAPSLQQSGEGPIPALNIMDEAGLIQQEGGEPIAESAPYFRVLGIGEAAVFLEDLNAK